MTKNERYGKQLYEKVGKKFVPVNDPYAYDGLGEGAWLVMVKPGSKSIRTAIRPSFIELETALRYLEDGLCEAMRKAGEMRPRTTKLSPKEQKAWNAYKKAMGKDMPTYLEYASLSEIAEAGCEYIHKIMVENNMSEIEKKYPLKIRSTNPILGLEL
jgi:hypothetical protein